MAPVIIFKWRKEALLNIIVSDLIKLETRDILTTILNECTSRTKTLKKNM